MSESTTITGTHAHNGDHLLQCHRDHYIDPYNDRSTNGFKGISRLIDCYGGNALESRIWLWYTPQLS